MKIEVDRREFLSKSSKVGGVVVVSALMSTIGKSVPAAASGGLADLPATKAVEAMRNGEIKSEQYARALLDRAENLKQLNAFRTLDPQSVLEAARSADTKRAAGGPLGALHGLPIPVKDSVNTKAFPTSSGTRALRDFRPKNDAPIVKSLVGEGAIIMGKTNLHELSFGWTSNNETFGPVRNPYNLDRTPGGSSGGSGVAVAARVAPLAVAEDTWASIRLPAAFCGLAGLRPTFGRYPDDGIMPLTAGRFDQVGPLARTVGDLVLFDSAVTGDKRQLSAASLKGVRIGVSREFFWEGLDPEVERLANEGLKKLRDAGAVIVEAKVPDIVKSSPDIAVVIISYDAKESIANFLLQQGTGVSFDEMMQKVSNNVKSLFEALALPPNRPSKEVYEANLVKLAALKAEVGGYFEKQGIAALVSPATMVPPPRIGEEDEVQIGGNKVPLAAALARNMALGSCGGMASLMLPAGLTKDSLPVGLEFAALPGKDRDLLGLGLSLEGVLGSIRPPKV